MLSFGIFAAFALVMAAARPGAETDPLAFFDSSAISRANRAKTRLFAESVASFCRFICDHLL
jgi:hypothetical protein